MVMGGIIAETFDTKTFFYNSLNNKWTSGPKLPQDRNGASCSILNWLNNVTGQYEKVVVVAGGDNLASSNLLFLDDFESGWVKDGSSLPENSFVGQMIEFEDSVILIGGQSHVGYSLRSLYQLDSPNGEWLELPQTLKEARIGHVAFLIPDELAHCY